MNKKSVFLAIFCAPLVFLTGCLVGNVSLDPNTDDPQGGVNNVKDETGKVPESNVTPPSKKKIKAQTNAIPHKIKLTMYIPDSGLLGYETKTVYVSAITPATDIVGKMLKQDNILPSGVRLIDYKVTINNNRVAKINMTTDPNSRQIFSAASAEVFQLGSLNETLTKNSRLNINKVELTENGEELQF
ncbi:MAG: GerMN domain-containing protein [Cyanobacteria bacterium J06635_10]